MYLSIGIGAILSTAFGFLFYGPLFGKIWKQSIGMTPDREVEMKKSMPKKIAVNFALQLITGFIMYTLFRMTGIVTPLGAIELTALAWVGFVLPLEVSGAVWSQKPSWSLFCLHSAHSLIAYCIMALSIILIS